MQQQAQPQGTNNAQAASLTLTNQQSQIVHNNESASMTAAAMDDDASLVLPLQNQQTFFIAPSDPVPQRQPEQAQQTSAQQTGVIDELHLVQHPSVDDATNESFPIVQAHRDQVQRARTMLTLGGGSRSRPLVANEDLLGSDSEDDQAESLELVAQQPMMRRSTTLNSAQIDSSHSTISFNNNNINSGVIAASRSPTPSNPFAAVRSNSSASFLSSIGQRAREGAFQPMQSLDSQNLLNPFARQPPLPSIAPPEESRPSADIALEEEKQGEAQGISEEENFARMLAGDNEIATNAPPAASLNLATLVHQPQTGTSAISDLIGLSAQQQASGQPSYTPPVAASRNQQQPTSNSNVLQDSRLHRSRSMYDAFTASRPSFGGLLSTMTNQRLPEAIQQPSLRRNHSYRSASHQQEPDADVISTSSLSLHRQENEDVSMTPSPSARQRYMNVPGLPRAPSSRVSNSDRHSQASGTPRDGLRQNMLRNIGARSSRMIAPVSPLPGLNPSMLQEMPNLHNRLRRQPATPNPSGARSQIRLSQSAPQETENEDNERAGSEASRSQRSTSQRDTQQLPRNGSRTNILAPLRPGEQIFSPAHDRGQFRFGNPIRPLVPVERLAPVVEEQPLPQPTQIQAPPPLQRSSTTTFLNPVPHVELQRTAQFAPGRRAGGNGDLYSFLHRSQTQPSFNIRLRPTTHNSLAQARDSVGSPPPEQGNTNQRRRRGVIMQGSELEALGTTLQRRRMAIQSTIQNIEQRQDLAANRLLSSGEAAGPEPRNAISTHERILRSLTGTNIHLGASQQPAADSQVDSNSYKSDDDSELRSSIRDSAEQDSILDSVSSNDDDDKADSFEVESEWSEIDQIFSVDLDEIYDQLQQQNDQNTPDRQINTDDIIEKLKKEQQTSRDLMKQYGTIGAVIFFRASKYGTLFKHDLFKKIEEQIQIPTNSCFLQNKIIYFVPRLCLVVNDCFATLNAHDEKQKQETDKVGSTSILQAYQFLDMLYKILPDDHAKLRRITLTKTIPNLIRFTKDLEELTLRLDKPEYSRIVTQQSIRSIEKKAQLYMRELLMAKIITDFKIQFHIATGLTSSSGARELTHDLLPFAIQLHALLPERLTLALYHLVLKCLPLKAHPKCKNQPLHKEVCGFIALSQSAIPIVNQHYKRLLIDQLELHQATLLRERSANKSKKCKTIQQLQSKLKQRREHKKQRKQQKLFTML